MELFLQAALVSSARVLISGVLNDRAFLKLYNVIVITRPLGRLFEGQCNARALIIRIRFFAMILYCAFWAVCF